MRKREENAEKKREKKWERENEKPAGNSGSEVESTEFREI